MVHGWLTGGSKCVQTLHSELIDEAEENPTFNHMWVIGSALRFPLPVLCQCHAALSMDLRERLMRLSPEPMVRAYAINGVVAPLLV